MTKRYSVYAHERSAKREGPEFDTWEAAKALADGLNATETYLVWHHNDDGTVTDVTDGDVEMEWWRCQWNRTDGFFADKGSGGTSLIDMEWRDGGVFHTFCYIQSATAPTAEQFQAHVLAETGVEVPCVQEPQWWYRTITGEWKEEKVAKPYFYAWHDGDWECRVYATESTRDAKAQALHKAAMAAGKGGDCGCPDEDIQCSHDGCPRAEVRP